jgi:pyochelin biosynthetic protein PchC
MAGSGVGEYIVRASGVGLRHLSGDADARHVLYCFPFLGGHSLAFRPLARQMPDNWLVVGVDPPGHGRMKDAEPARDFPSLLGAYCDALCSRFRERPFYLLGHSLGSLVVFRLTRLLEDLGRPPRAMFLSAPPPPEGRPTSARAAHMDDESLAAMLVREGFLPRFAPVAAESRQALLRAVRADFALIADFDARRCTPPETPAFILFSREDTLSPPGAVTAWRDVLQHAEFLEVAGDHGYIISQAGLVARRILQTVEGLTHGR